MKKNVILLISQIKVKGVFDLLNSTSICDDYNKQQSHYYRNHIITIMIFMQF